MVRDGGLRQLFRKHLPMVFMTSVETGATGRGTPDSFMAYSGRSWWVEFKSTTGFVVDLRPEQIAWHLRLARTGNTSFIVIRRKLSQLIIVNGIYADQITSIKKAPLSILHTFNDGPTHWDWDHILETLIERPEKRPSRPPLAERDLIGIIQRKPQEIA